MRKEHSLKAYENEIMMKIFSSKRTEGTRSYGKLRNDKIHNLHSLPDNEGKSIPLQAWTEI